LNEALAGAKIDRTDNWVRVHVCVFDNLKGIAPMQLRLTAEDRKCLQEIADRTYAEAYPDEIATQMRQNEVA
jgi:hypothetical protein